MRHLLVSREFPPASYAAGGIGAYAETISRLMAEGSETVHVIGERWSGAPLERQERYDGRLVVHRLPIDDASLASGDLVTDEARRMLGEDTFPAQRFAWRAALLAEVLIEREGIEVVEGQDWEAPLYYLLGRRSMGLGPSRRPPCVVHLHTPTEFIFRHNHWAPHRPEQLATIRMEEYCVSVADALLSPSQYMAREAGVRYAIPPDEITVIPYPIGDALQLQRDEATWRDGSIIYVGRLEGRKGLIEFVDAAVQVARRTPTASFDFVGEDSPHQGRTTVREYMESRISRDVRARFRFHGVLPRSQLPTVLQGARVAVVPSRAENFPYACMEAMASGLPIVASPNGGMVEMVDDGLAGWIASSQSARGLAEALQRALATPADALARMGETAARAIRQRCNNEVILRQQLAFRKGIASTGPTRSVGESTNGLVVPAFVPVSYVAAPSVRNILALSPREMASLVMSAMREPRRAITWLGSTLRR